MDDGTFVVVFFLPLGSWLILMLGLMFAPIWFLGTHYLNSAAWFDK